MRWTSNSNCILIQDDVCMHASIFPWSRKWRPCWHTGPLSGSVFCFDLNMNSESANDGMWHFLTMKWWCGVTFFQMPLKVVVDMPLPQRHINFERKVWFKISKNEMLAMQMKPDSARSSCGWYRRSWSLMLQHFLSLIMYSSEEFSPMERQQLRRMLASFNARDPGDERDDQIPHAPDSKPFVLRMGDGKCIHEAHCHHTRRAELAPTKFYRCHCIQAIVRKQSYYLDWKGFIHDTMECKDFEGRPGSGQDDIKMAKAVFQVCTQCHWPHTHILCDVCPWLYCFGFSFWSWSLRGSCNDTIGSKMGDQKTWLHSCKCTIIQSCQDIFKMSFSELNGHGAIGHGSMGTLRLMSPPN